MVKKKSFAFALKIIEPSKILRNKKDYVFADQLLRSGTSIGANVCEASVGQSKRDSAKMAISSKEARETRYWLRLLDQGNIIEQDLFNYLNEIEEIIKVLTKIVKTTSKI